MKDLEAYTGQMQKAFKGPEVEEGEEPPEIPAVGHVADMIAQSKTWQWAGIGFGEQETYRLQKSLKKLANTTQVAVRFFGKITGTESDYYIAEADIAEEEAEEGAEEGRDADFEVKPIGVNKFTYFVTSNSLGEWVKLPDVSPSEIIASRQIKMLFTGDLNKKIFTNPFFKGTEKNYLRAQIARITHSTTLVPKGLMKVNEDEPETRQIDEIEHDDDNPLVMPSTHTMKSLDMWQHYYKGILLNGRTSLNDPVAPEGEEWEDERMEEEKLKLLKRDPYDDLLKPISKDRKINVSKTLQQPAWCANVMGDATEFMDAGKKQCNGVAVVRSLQWPGAYTFYTNGGFSQLYVGNGHKYEQNATFYPVDPPLIEADPEEYDGPTEPEQTEPAKPVPAEEAEAEPEEAE